MFDIGWDELFLIALVALVVIGPKDLPGVLRVLGVWIARARNLAGEFRSHVDEMIREANVDEMKREFSAMAAPPELKEMEDNLMLGNPLSPSEPKTPEPEVEAPAETAPEKIEPAPEPARNDAAE
jgi:sec-independent protein translocase protein TatB